MIINKIKYISILLLFHIVMGQSLYYLQLPGRSIAESIKLEQQENSFSIPKEYFVGRGNRDNSIDIAQIDDFIVMASNDNNWKIKSLALCTQEIPDYNYYLIDLRKTTATIIYDDSYTLDSDLKFTDRSVFPFQAMIDIDNEKIFEFLLKDFLGDGNFTQDGTQFSSNYFGTVDIGQLGNELYRLISFKKPLKKKDEINILPAGSTGLAIRKKIKELKVMADNIYKIPNVNMKLNANSEVYSVYKVPKKYKYEKMEFIFPGFSDKIIKEDGDEYLRLPLVMSSSFDNFYSCTINDQKHSVRFLQDNSLEISNPRLIIFDLNSTKPVNYKSQRKNLELMNKVNQYCNNSHNLPMKLYYIFPDANVFKRYNINEVITKRKDKYSRITSQNVKEYNDFRRKNGMELVDPSSIPSQFFSLEQLDHFDIDKSLPTTMTKENSFSYDIYLCGIVNIAEKFPKKNWHIDEIVYVTYYQVPEFVQQQVTQRTSFKIKFLNIKGNEKLESQLQTIIKGETI